MTTYVFDSMAQGGVTGADFTFADVLQFQNAGSQAAFVSLNWADWVGGGSFDVHVRTQEGPFPGKSVFLKNVSDFLQLSSANFSFAGGGDVFIGDDTSFSTQDNQANTLSGTAGSDYFLGLGGNDTLTGGGGDDRFHFYVQG